MESVIINTNSVESTVAVIKKCWGVNNCFVEPGASEGFIVWSVQKPGADYVFQITQFPVHWEVYGEVSTRIDVGGRLCVRRNKEVMSDSGILERLLQVFGGWFFDGVLYNNGSEVYCKYSEIVDRPCRPVKDIPEVSWEEVFEKFGHPVRVTGEYGVAVQKFLFKSPLQVNTLSSEATREFAHENVPSRKPMSPEECTILGVWIPKEYSLGEVLKVLKDISFRLERGFTTQSLRPGYTLCTLFGTMGVSCTIDVAVADNDCEIWCEGNGHRKLICTTGMISLGSSDFHTDFVQTFFREALKEFEGWWEPYSEDRTSVVVVYRYRNDNSAEDKTLVVLENCEFRDVVSQVLIACAENGISYEQPNFLGESAQIALYDCGKRLSINLIKHSEPLVLQRTMGMRSTVGNPLIISTTPDGSGTKAYQQVVEVLLKKFGGYYSHDKERLLNKHRFVHV